MTKPYPHILRLARSGSPERAWSLMEQHNLLDSDTDQRALTLQARLVKDRAKRAEGTERARLFAESSAIYAKAGAIDNGSYPLINAASLSLLAGQKARSEALARDVLAALEGNPEEAETPYWLGATRAEALLLIGHEPEARAALRGAVTKQPAAWEDHAATLGQFELLYAELGYDAAWLDQIRPPSALQFAGLMHVALEDCAVPQQISEWLEREAIGFGYGALAAGSDIWIAEALLERGAELHVVLPCDAPKFRDISVVAVDAEWGPRFDVLMEAATSIECLPHSQGPDAAAVERGDAVACGMASHHAMRLRSQMRRLRIAGDTDAVEALSKDDVALIKAKRLGSRPSRSDTSTDRLKAVVKTSSTMQFYDSLAEGFAAASNHNGPTAMDWVLCDSDRVPSAISEGLSAMLDCAEADQCLATHAAGFGMLGRGADVRVESAGEMRWAGGRTPLYAIS